MLDEEMNQPNAPDCVENKQEQPKKGGLANLKKFDSEKGKEAALKRWSSNRFAKVRSYIKQTCLEEVEKRAEAIAKANADFMEAGDYDGVRAIQEGLKGLGAHAENEEKALSLNMKMDAKVKGTVEQKRNVVINFRRATPEDAK